MRRCLPSRRWAAHDPAGVHHHRGPAAGRRGASRQRAGAAAHRDPRRLFAADADDEGERRHPAAAGRTQQCADAVHGPCLCGRGLPLRSLRRPAQADGAGQPGLYVRVVLHPQRSRLLRHQRPLGRPQGDRTRSDDGRPARRLPEDEEVTAADRLIIDFPTTTGLIVLKALAAEPGLMPQAQASLAASQCAMQTEAPPAKQPEPAAPAPALCPRRRASADQSLWCAGTSERVRGAIASRLFLRLCCTSATIVPQQAVLAVKVSAIAVSATIWAA